jgi:drug/metabolite transporter (DMT)-like permease
MSRKDGIILCLLGLFIWAVGTLVYRLAGSYFFESSTVGYWMNAIVTAILYSIVGIGLMKWLRIKSEYWLYGAVCVALPGMLGEVLVLSTFSELMVNMQPETAGRYGAFLFGGYSCLISSAWLMSIKKGSQDFVNS